MAKFWRKEGVEAFKLTAKIYAKPERLPAFVQGAIADGTITPLPEDHPDGFCAVRTDQGQVGITNGDWLVREPDGGFIVVPDDVFVHDYKPMAGA